MNDHSETEKKENNKDNHNEKRNTSNGSAANEQEFGIQRLYVKDLSFESPAAPKVFLEEYHPEIKIDLMTKHAKLDDQYYDVMVRVTVKAEQAGKPLFLAEVDQAGIFALLGFEEAMMEQLLAVVCPNILFPYAREAISETVTKGGFPPVYLAPVNFEALFHEKKAQEEGVDRK